MKLTGNFMKQKSVTFKQVQRENQAQPIFEVLTG